MSDKNPTVVEAAKAQAAALVADAEASVAAVPGIIAALEQAGISAPYMERALGLPVGSVKKWTAGEISPEEMALLKIVCLFPRMLEVADAGYDQSVAKAALIVTAGEMMLEDAKENVAKIKMSAIEVSARKYDWVDGLEPGNVFHEIEKRIQFTVVAINDADPKRFKISHEVCGERVVIDVFPEFIRARCAFGVIPCSVETP